MSLGGNGVPRISVSIGDNSELSYAPSRTNESSLTQIVARNSRELLILSKTRDGERIPVLAIGAGTARSRVNEGTL